MRMIPALGLVGCGLLSLSGATEGAGQIAPIPPAIRIDEEIAVELRQLYVTVTTRKGQPVLDLASDELTLLVDGRRQEIVTFAGGGIPFTAILLIDGSASMAGTRLRAALGGAWAFVAGMQRLDQAQLMVFSDRLLALTPIAGQGAELTAALAGTSAAGGTAIFDHLYLALDQLEARQGLRVVVLLSDGMDVESVLRPADLEPVVRRSRAIIYWVRLSERQSPRLVDRYPPNPWHDQRTAAREFEHLESLVRLSGGRSETLHGIADVEPALRGILAELHDQYALGFYPDPQRHDGSWRTVRVKAGRGGLRVRTREGFVDE